MSMKRKNRLREASSLKKSDIKEQVAVEESWTTAQMAKTSVTGKEDEEENSEPMEASMLWLQRLLGSRNTCAERCKDRLGSSAGHSFCRPLCVVYSHLWDNYSVLYYCTRSVVSSELLNARTHATSSETLHGISLATTLFDTIVSVSHR